MCNYTSNNIKNARNVLLETESTIDFWHIMAQELDLPETIIERVKQDFETLLKGEGSTT